MDNRIFNVNGRTKDDLLATIRLAFSQDGRNTTAKAYFIDPKKGMILLWHTDKGSIPFPAPLSAESAATMVWDWLQTKPDTECVDWDKNLNHDGHNVPGFRAFVEDWGHVATGPNYNTSDSCRYAIVAVKPTYLWMGK